MIGRSSGCVWAALCVWIVVGCESLIDLKDWQLIDGGETSGDGGRESGPPASPSACKTYCSRVQASCQGKYKVYTDESACLALCEQLSADEVSCRDEEARKAASSQEYWDHCHAAGPAGSTTCGSNCESYCETMSKACEEPEREKDFASCLRKCAGLRDRENMLRGLPADTSRYDVSADHEGDTLQCRIVHATIAVGAPEGHCWHAAIAPKPGPGGALNPCSTGISEIAPHCEDYCQVLMKACKGEHAVYQNEAQCLATCAALDLGTVSDDVGTDTVGCRKTHSYNALVTEDFGKHCPHSGPGGAGVCGDDCSAYCRLLEKGCADGFAAEYGSGASAAQSCKSQCLAMRGSEPIHDYSVMTAEAESPLTCRLFYTTKALEQPDQPEHCSAALGKSKCK